MDRAELCVYCRQRPADSAHRPFCSDRCRLLDLSRWVDGSYHIPAEPIPQPPLSPLTDDETDR